MQNDRKMKAAESAMPGVIEMWHGRGGQGYCNIAEREAEGASTFTKCLSSYQGYQPLMHRNLHHIL